ncbi:MAG: hypothetical protein CVV42_16055 [Candidatus Riflebacteria bacterium HGW-Riflebacteria-2]|jgi:hypothetical protein|nr:MAG: hypothetical protein CVV42_16055 [Candidatus Riflebacteria bacterium HGW-Riflebacteria-2]
MKFFGAFSQYKALSDEQKSFISDAQKKFVKTPDELVKFFKPMAVFDKTCDEARAQLLNYVILFGILSFLGIFATAALAEDYSIVIAVELLLVILTFIGIIVRWRLGKIDIHNNLREFVVPVVNLVGQDMEAGTKISLDLDLRGKTLDNKLKDTRKDDPGWFSYPKVTTRIYDDPWFKLTGQLVDGSKLILNVDDQVTRLDKTYKSMSGKIKSKTKYKVKHEIMAGLALKHKKYAVTNENELGTLGDGLKYKDGDNRQLICLKDKIKTQDVDAHIDPQRCLALLGKIFMSVQPAAEKGS